MAFQSYPIHEAVERGDLETLGALLKDASEADVNMKGPPLKSIVDRLQRPGLQPTPLSRAVDLGNEAACKLLLAAGAQPTYASENLVANAAKSGRVGILRLLLAAGADPDQKDPTWRGSNLTPCTGATPLYMAADQNLEGAATALIEYGADVDLGMGGYYKPPLVPAFAFGRCKGARRRIAFKLLRAGAKIGYLLHDRGRGGGPFVGGRWADGFSPSDRAMLEKFHEAGGYLAFEQARIEEAVLARLVDRGEKLPKELIDVVVEFLELPRWRPAPAPKKE